MDDRMNLVSDSMLIGFKYLLLLAYLSGEMERPGTKDPGYIEETILH